jgi:hypothetical protein
MNIVPVEEIPKVTQNTPIDNLLELYSTGQRMEK